jgi:hypothetical protein
VLKRVVDCGCWPKMKKEEEEEAAHHCKVSLPNKLDRVYKESVQGLI